ncbi:MAG: carbohydrate binding domain-containing protein [Candidatus Theseobacter exili]|nr:carbohydrate binding domain-containing protein [Candidatus Theseobacter exili]
MRMKGYIGLMSFLLNVLHCGQASALSENNILLNPGFEKGEESWYNWCVGENAGEITNEITHSGQQSAKRKITGKGMGCFGQVKKVEPGDTIKFRAWIKSPQDSALTKGAQVYLRIEFWGNEKPLKTGHKESLRIENASKTWEKIEVEAVVPIGAQEARLLAYSVGHNDTSKGIAYFDDMAAEII